MATLERHSEVPQSALIVGASGSMPIVSVRQSEALPATSMIWVSSLCEPFVLIVTGPAGCTTPSTFDTIVWTPDIASVPVTVLV